MVTAFAIWAASLPRLRVAPGCTRSSSRERRLLASQGLRRSRVGVKGTCATIGKNPSIRSWRPASRDSRAQIGAQRAKTPPFRRGGRHGLGRRQLALPLLDVRGPRCSTTRCATACRWRPEVFDANGFWRSRRRLSRSLPPRARRFPCRAGSTGQFYALQQSPQISRDPDDAGTDRYFQIVRLIPRRDQRADRSSSYTQVDVECSLARRNVYDLIEPVMRSFKE